MTRDQCLAKAAEAEELANIVAFERDKQRFRASAAEWRERATQAETVGHPPQVTQKATFWRR
jgi:hypothetical protein